MGTDEETSPPPTTDQQATDLPATDPPVANSPPPTKPPVIPPTQPPVRPTTPTPTRKPEVVTQKPVNETQKPVNETQKPVNETEEARTDVTKTDGKGLSNLSLILLVSAAAVLVAVTLFALIYCCVHRSGDSPIAIEPPRRLS